MMGEDEEGTYQTLTANLESIRSIISEHKGRIFSSPGDAVMAEFSSVVDAVKCAVELQENIEAANADIPEDQKMQFRIGVNLGDVIHDGKQVYGNGVNISARIETLAEPGGVSISRTVYDHVHNKLKYRFEYQGEHQVKNIAEPVRVYKILMEPEFATRVIDEEVNTSPSMPSKPTIAVLPFVNMSGDPNQEYFSDGLTEQIINGLCKISNLFVIARNSSFAYKGKSLNVQQIGKELGVRFVIEGSVQKSGERVRITSQLIDTITGYHLWSENYDRDLSDIFALQDEITLKLINTMQIKLVSGEEARLWAGATKSIKAYDSYMRANDFFERFNEKDNIQARKFCKQAINIDKDYAMAYALLGFTHFLDLGYGWSEAPIKSFEKAERNAKKALALNDSLDIAHCLLGMICLNKRQYGYAIKAGQRAIELNPNGARAHSLFGFILLCSDKTELSIKLLNRAILLSPIPPSYVYVFLAMAYRNIGEYEKAVELAKKGLVGNPDQISPNLVLAASYCLLNRTKEAHKAVEEILRVDPSFSVGIFSDQITYKNQETKDRYVKALRNAGLPE